jgi:hypothetical protein
VIPVTAPMRVTPEFRGPPHAGPLGCFVSRVRPRRMAPAPVRTGEGRRTGSRHCRPMTMSMPRGRLGGKGARPACRRHPGPWPVGRTRLASCRHQTGGRVRRWGRPHPLPSEPDVRLATHPAQASNNASAWHDRARFHRPTTPLRRRGLPIGLGVNLDSTTAEPVSEIGGGRTYGRCRPRQICFAPRAGWLSVPVRQHPREGSSLTRGVMSQPLSGPLRAGLRFLPGPLPAAPSTHLTAGLPSREDDGLTTLHRRNPRGLVPASTPVARHLRRMS